jgi:hypothetical protein
MCIRFYANIRKNAVETLAMIIQTLREESMISTWVFECKCPNSPRPNKAIQVKSRVKSMLIISFQIKGIFHKEFTLAGQTVTSEYYCDMLWQLHENM